MISKAALKTAMKPAWLAAMNLLPARTHVQCDYLRVYQRLPNLENPQSFSEKIASRKMYDRDKRLPDLVDKIRVKEIIGKRFGEQLVFPTLGVWEDPQSMDFSKAPLTSFPYVLKANHASGTNIFIHKQEDLADPERLRKQLAKFLKINWSSVAEEWAYSQVTPKIFAEPYIETPEGYLADYKFHVFSGRVYAIEKIVDRFRNYGIGFHDRGWNRLDLGYLGYYPRYKGDMTPPLRLQEMIAFSEELGREFSYVRVDLYEVEGQMKLGELTFYPSAGHDRFDNDAWDMEFGQQWKIDWQTGA
jgi:hypothetical protein